MSKQEFIKNGIARIKRPDYARWIERAVHADKNRQKQNLQKWKNLLKLKRSLI